MGEIHSRSVRVIVYTMSMSAKGPHYSIVSICVYVCLCAEISVICECLFVQIRPCCCYIIIAIWMGRITISASQEYASFQE